MRVCTNAEMKALDTRAEREFGIGSAILMENAGRAAVDVLLERYPDAGQEHEVLVFAGKGNNAGDAFVVARRLLSLDRKVRVFLLSEQARYQGDARAQLDILLKLGVQPLRLERGSELMEYLEHQGRGYRLAVDGILGTGLKGDLSDLFFEVIEILNTEMDAVLALDIPSGVSGDSGRVHGIAVQSDVTVSFGFPKLGHFIQPGAEYCGELVNVDISLPARFSQEGERFLLNREEVTQFLVPRDPFGHKNRFGHVLVIGGSLGKLGAACLAARAAQRTGAGLVTIATWPEAFDLMSARIPDEVMLEVCPSLDEGAGPESVSNLDQYISELKPVQTVVIGPGLSRGPRTERLLCALLERYPGPLVIDADGLNAIADGALHSWLLARKHPVLLTPHPGEMARLLERSTEEVVRAPDQAVRALVERTGALVLLKGATTWFGAPGEAVYLHHSPNDGIAKAGSGDALSGILGALLAQGQKPRATLALGIVLHSLAGELAAERLGARSMTVHDAIDALAEVFRSLETGADDVG